MIDSSEPYFDSENSPFDPATGKLTRHFKGGGRSKPPAPAPARAAETPSLVGQANADSYGKMQDRRARNNYVIGAASDSTFGQKLKLGY